MGKTVLDISNITDDPLYPEAHILIVEDNRDLLELLHEMLESLGHHVVSVKSAESAIKIMSTEKFDIIISDIFLPGINGLELLEYISDHYPCSDVIIMTGYTEKYSYSEIIKAGAIDFMPKPFDMETLEAKLVRVLRERQLIKDLYLIKSRKADYPSSAFADNNDSRGAHKKESWPVELQGLYAKIEEIESRYQKIFEYAGDFVILTELSSGNAKIININNTCLAALGCDKTEVLGQSIFSFLESGEIEKVKELQLKMLSPGFETVIFETEIKGIDNKTIPIEINAVLIYMNKLPYVLSLARDITENKQGTKALMESESRYRAIFENSAVGLGLSDLSQENPPGRYVDCNGTLAAIAGISKEELTSSPDLADLMINQQISWSKYYQEDLANSENLSRYSWIRPDGKENHIVCETKVISLDNRQYVLSIHRDVTGRVKADEKIQELSRQMGLAVEKEKKRIALDLHDELGQQLHCMRYLVDNLTDSLDAAVGDDRKISKLLLDLHKLIGQLSVTCRDITFQLSPARLEKSKMADIVYDLIDFFRDSCPGKTINSVIKGDWDDVDPYTKTVVFRIIQEALNNVIEHSEARNVRIALKSDADNRLLIIEDDGIGFDFDNITKAEGDNVNKRGYGLLGMQERVNSVNGHLEFHRKNLGTTIEILLPRGSA